MVIEVKKTSNNGIETINVIRKGSKETKEKTLYEIDPSKEEVRVFNDKFGSTERICIVFEGFKKLPDIFTETSNYDGGTLNSIYNHAIKSGLNGIVISKKDKNAIRKGTLVINYQDYKRILEEIERVKGQQRILKQRIRSRFLKETFPSTFSGLRTAFPSISDSINREIIDEEVLKRLKLEKLENIVYSVSSVIKTKYEKEMETHNKKMIVVANLPLLKKTAEDLNKLMSKKTTELKFKEFLMNRFPLIRFDCVYLEPELNLICGGARKSDFLMINSEGFADIFEIKLPTTPMLKFDKSHKNYYWSPEAAQAISQIEKYLDYAQRNNLAIKDTLSKRAIEVNIVKPKGVLIMGSDEQLNEKGKDEESDKKEDFRILRTSLKNIEILTYSDLLRSISNLIKSNESKQVAEDKIKNKTKKEKWKTQKNTSKR